MGAQSAGRKHAQRHTHTHLKNEKARQTCCIFSAGFCAPNFRGFFSSERGRKEKIGAAIRERDKG